MRGSARCCHRRDRVGQAMGERSADSFPSGDDPIRVEVFDAAGGDIGQSLVDVRFERR